MTISVVKKGFKKHLAQIMRTWEGVDFTLTKITEVKDKRGRIIGTSGVDSIIHGLIGEITNRPEHRGIGWLNLQDSSGFFATGQMIDKGDSITWGTDKYEVTAIHATIYDIDELCAIQTEVKRIK